MTRQEILDMKAGRELDALVAEKCLGKKRSPEFGIVYDCPHYSTDLNAAWGALAKKYVFDITHIVMHDNEIYETDIDVNGKLTFQGTGRLSSQELAEVICKAALVAELGL